MRVNTNDPADNNIAPKISLARKDYPSEVEEIWMQDRQHMAGRIQREINDNGVENWLETEAEQDPD